MRIDHTLSSTQPWERDHRLSFKARGLLAELLSYDDGVNLTIDDLADAKHAPGAPREGRDAMRKAAQELAAAGYVVKERVRLSGRWCVNTFVFADPARAKSWTELDKQGHRKRLVDNSDHSTGTAEQAPDYTSWNPPADMKINTAYPAPAHPALLVTGQAQPKEPKSKDAPTRGAEDPAVRGKADHLTKGADEIWPEVADIPGAWADALYDRE